MVGSGMFDGLFSAIIVIMVVFGLILSAITGTIVYFINDDIESKTLIKPEIKLVVRDNNKIDTIYIYKEQ